MKTITVKELKEILEKHKKWLKDEAGGVRADLYGAYLRDADLQRADLQGTDLRGADLRGAYLRGADLRGAYLRGADLLGADLRGANLQYADLLGANLRDTNLQNADLYCAKLQGVQRPWLVYTGNIGSRYAETLYFVDYDSVRCGCWNDDRGGTLAEFKARIDEAYPADSENEEYQRYRLEYLSAIKMFESMREAYLKSAEKNNEKNI